ncbi:hypothetical protein Pth03_46790 [Planotetraspora thailandica]|uniref:Uncharacterized protein n=1 Tax=Planotetraspora thailandica TaxID=487172 RepID=A0A8J3V568_9ACTN|nr:hypothetical protein [Planotetraspora thailandica]GII56290.1 hypothetical protein Pth03_46790 [Planotetraspora thailandica]
MGTSKGRARGGLAGPALVNLALGVPAIVPLYLGRWLLAEYMPMDCRSVEDLAKPGLTNCNYTTLDHASIVMFLLVVTGLFTLALVVVIDVALPFGRGRRLAAWLGTAVLIPVPFAVLLALA